MTRIEQYIGGQMHDFQDLEYDLANRLWKKCRVTYENDANGNRISRTLDSKTLNYVYDGENRLTQVMKNGVDVLDNVYDGSGMRIKEVKGGQTTYFVYQGNNPLIEYTPSDGKYKYFIYAGTKMVAEETDSVVKYYLTDHLGSTRVITDAAGNKVAEYKFRPYGEKDSSSGAFSTDYKFTGKPLIDDVGLSYFGARFYDPETGRFLSQDPAKQGLNWYEYANNNPLRYVDPDGRAYTEAIALTSWEINFIPGYGTLAYICLVVSAAGIEYGPTVMQTLQGLYSSAEAAAKGTQGSNGSQSGNSNGKKPDKTKHAEYRDSNGRPTGTVVNDIQKARVKDILIQDDGNIIVRGANGRVHVLSPDGQRLITTLTRTDANINKLIQEGRYTYATAEEAQNIIGMYK